VFGGAFCGAPTHLLGGFTNAILKMDQAIVAASIAKLLATEIAERIALRSMIVHGGYGVSSGGVERLLRDVEIMKTYEGTNDIQKLIIVREAARRLLGLQI
jgi:Acyl-CoA dehydrogenases